MALNVRQMEWNSTRILVYRMPRRGYQAFEMIMLFSVSYIKFITKLATYFFILWSDSEMHIDFILKKGKDSGAIP